MSHLGDFATTIWTAWGLALAVGMTGQLVHLMRPSDKAELLYRAAGRIHQELWLFVPPGILISTIHHWHSSKSWLVVFDALSLYNWWAYRNWPEDNHWKRRGKRALESVERRAGRLVVVPVEGGA